MNLEIQLILRLLQIIALYAGWSDALDAGVTQGTTPELYDTNPRFQERTPLPYTLGKGSHIAPAVLLWFC